MGAVHGVHLKYAAMSAMCGTCAWRSHGAGLPDDAVDAEPTLRASALTAALYYSALVHFVITVLFVSRAGEFVIGKDHSTGKVPLWSYAVWWPFHLPTWLYTFVHTWHSERHGVPVASEVVPGWWLGGRYANRLRRSQPWAGTVDLTVEFDEGCRDSTAEYLLLACWDGTPPSAEGIESAAVFCARCSSRGDVMVHCAHGRGRSTCVLVACLVRAGVYSSWRDAFDGIKVKRKGIKLNSKMRRALDEWESRYAKAQ